MGQLAKQIAGQKVYIASSRDLSPYERFYPFAETIDRNLSNAALRVGAKLGGVLEAKYFIYPGFEVRSETLSLSIVLRLAASGETLASEIFSIDFKNLPVAWNKRTLQDVSYELALKLERSLFTKKIMYAPEAIDITDEKGLVSEFSSQFKAYLTRALSARRGFQRVSPGSEVEGLVVLKGSHQSLGNDILLDVAFIDAASGGVRADAQAIFIREDIPPQLALAPDNEQAAVEASEPMDSVVPYGLEGSIRMWVNKESGAYVDGDNLTVTMRPKQDLYIRMYYVMSDGMICQIFPSGPTGTGFVRKNQLYEVGGPRDAVELIISDSTKGQEVIKAFASLDPIDDKRLPTIFNEGANMACMEEGYRELQRSLTRALGLQSQVRPVAEVKILVSD